MSSSLRTTLPTLLALLFGYALMQMGNTLQGTLLSVRGHLDGFPTTEIGAVGAAFWVGIVIGSLWAGRVIQQVGHTRAFAALAAVAASVALLHLLVVQPVVWIVARALTGFCFAGLFVAVESWLNASATPETRGQILGFYGMTGLIAGIGARCCCRRATRQGSRSSWPAARWAASPPPGRSAGSPTAWTVDT